MNKKLFFIGIMMIMLFLMTVSNAFAFRLVADLGDIRIYSTGVSGQWVVESDRAQQSIPLSFRQIRAGTVEIACSSFVRTATASGIGVAVEWVIRSKLGGEQWVSSLAGTVANWAARQGIDYLCN